MIVMPNKKRLILRVGAALFLCALLVHVSGCSVNIRGKRVPLIRHKGFSGEIVLEAERHENTQTTGNTKRTSTDIVFNERLNIRTEGYVYHQNLLPFSFGLGIGFLQSKMESGSIKNTRKGTINEYDLSGSLLPLKPYPVSFAFSKQDSFTTQSFSGSLRSETQSSRVTLSLRETDWPMRFHYGKTESDQRQLGLPNNNDYSRTDERFAYSLQHEFTPNSVMDFDFERQEIIQERGISVNSRNEDRYDLKHILNFGKDERHSLRSSLYYSEQTGSYDLERTRFVESLRLKHSDSLTTNYRFTFNNNKRATTENDQYQFTTGFTHRLYQSLVTTGSFHYSDETFNDSIKTNRTGTHLGFNYRKRNRWGAFSSNYSVSFLELEQEGGSESVDVIDERHLFSVIGSLRIELNRRNIDPDTIEVNNSGRTKIYFTPADYTISQTDGITFLEIEAIGDIFADGDQTLSIDYAFIIEPEREESIVMQSFGLRQQFKNGISVYFRHQRRDEEIDSTSTDVASDDFRINTYGADYRNKGFRLSAEYSKKKSTFIPYTTKRIHGNYGWSISPRTKASVYASQNWSDLRGTNPHEVTSFIVGASVTSKLSDKYMLSSSLNYYKHEDNLGDSGDSEGYKLDSHLKYAFRQLRFLAGAEYSVLKRTQHKTERTLMYMKLKRLF